MLLSCTPQKVLSTIVHTVKHPQALEYMLLLYVPNSPLCHPQTRVALLQPNNTFCSQTAVGFYHCAGRPFRRIPLLISSAG